MKKILLILITFCMSAGFAFGQTDWNITITKATNIINNKYYFDSFGKKRSSIDGRYPAYFVFTATEKKHSIILQNLDSPYFLPNFRLYDASNNYILSSYYSKNDFFSKISKYVFDNLTIGNKYYINVSFLQIGIDQDGKFKIGVFNTIDNDFKTYPNTLTENNIYNFNVNDYTRGRDINSSCISSKADSNTVDLFVKFTALATNETIIINADNANYETLVELTTAPNTCNAAFQKGQNQRFYTFSGLTIGTEYTARVEFGGDAPIGFARLNAANNASIVLKSGVVTSLKIILLNQVFKFPQILIKEVFALNQMKNQI